MRKAAAQIVFDPREPGPMSVIVDQDDPKYWEQRAIEQIREIHQTFNITEEEIVNRLRNACSLLLLSVVKRTDGQDKKAGPRRG